MYNTYESFLKEFDSLLNDLFEKHKKYIFCKKGCTYCCEKGNYPFSQIEFWYLTKGFISLNEKTKILIQQNIRRLKKEKEENPKNFEHECPFLINGECSVYQYRGIICRTFGLCYRDEKRKYIIIPYCVKKGLNYSKYYDSEEEKVKIEDIINQKLNTYDVLNSELAQKYNIDYVEIRPLLDWFEQK